MQAAATMSLRNLRLSNDNHKDDCQPGAHPSETKVGTHAQTILSPSPSPSSSSRPRPRPTVLPILSFPDIALSSSSSPSSASLSEDENEEEQHQGQYRRRCCPSSTPLSPPRPMWLPPVRLCPAMVETTELEIAKWEKERKQISRCFPPRLPVRGGPSTTASTFVPGSLQRSSTVTATAMATDRWAPTSLSSSSAYGCSSTYSGGRYSNHQLLPLGLSRKEDGPPRLSAALQKRRTVE